jgi:hypothetical protein
MHTDEDSLEIVAQVVVGVEDEDGALYERSSVDGQELPDRVGYEEYQHYVGETWHQRGQECTGFALAAIANYLIRKGLENPDAPSVSRRMVYEMAQLHDGEEFGEGSTLRGAIEGWTRSGIARDALWPYDPDDEYGTEHGTLTLRRLLDARARPLMHYRRVVGGDLDSARDALAHGHPLFTGTVMHEGWHRLFLPDTEPLIERGPDDDDKGGHAFVIVGYDDRGFWIHNSWGPEWGVEGYGLLPFEEWSTSGFDAWVVDAEPPRLREPQPSDAANLTNDEVTTSYRDMWPHLVVLRDDGKLASEGLYEMDAGSLGALMYLFGERTKHWSSRRLAIVSDGGYLPAAVTIERLRSLRDRYLDAEIYPIFVVWETSWWRELGDELAAWIARLADGEVIAERLDRDDPIVRAAVERSVLPKLWDELVMRTNQAVLDRAATSGDSCPGCGHPHQAPAAQPPDAGGARLLAKAIAKKRTKIDFDLHLHSHGVGDLLSARLAELLPAPIATATAVASALPSPLAQRHYAALLDELRLGHLTVVALDDQAEADDSVGVVAGSFLQLAADALTPPGTSVLGLGEQTEAILEGAGDRLELIRWPSSDHLALAWDPAVHDAAIRTMLAHEPPSPSEPLRETHMQATEVETMPTDPLAFAIARQRSARADRA